MHRLLDQLRPGDVLVVWKLDRLSRSLKDLLHIVERVKQAGAGFRNLTEAVDTMTPAGRMLAQMLGAFAEFERSMIRERTRAGLETARRKGRVGGRPRALNEDQRRVAVELVASGKKTGAEVARLLDVHPCTIARELARHRAEVVERRVAPIGGSEENPFPPRERSRGLFEGR